MEYKDVKPFGRPKIYNNCLDLDGRAELYFESCWQTVEYTKGKGDNVISWSKWEQTRPYTMAGLAQALGMSTQSLLNYHADQDFFSLIKRHRHTCELYCQEQLYRKEPVAGVIFTAKNHYGMSDKVEHEISGGITAIYIDDMPKADQIALRKLADSIPDMIMDAEEVLLIESEPVKEGAK